MNTVRFFLAASAMSLKPPDKHLADARARVDRSWKMVPKSDHDFARSSMGVAVAVRTLHNPQVMAVISPPVKRGGDRQTYLVWGHLVWADGKEKLGADDLRGIIDGKLPAPRTIGVAVEGQMRSPNALNEAVEDLVSNVIRSWSISELELELAIEDILLDDGEEG